MIASVACFHYQINTQCSLAWFFTTPWQQSVFPQESTLVCAVLHVHSCLLYFTSFCVFVHKPCAISMCLYSMRALLIHLCRSLPRVSLSHQPHYSHILPPTYPPLVGLIIACHFATHTHAWTCTLTHTHTCSPSLISFSFLSFAVSAILLLLYLSLFM